MHALLDETISAQPPADSRGLTPQDISDKLSYAFQLATAHGPLCQEPLQGVAVILEDISISSSSTEDAVSGASARLNSEIIKTTREAMRQGFLDWSPRLLLAMYSCEIQASSKCRNSLFLIGHGMC